MPVNITYTADNDNVVTDGTVFNNGDLAWMLMSSALVFIMIPGVGFLYSGLLRRKNALSMLFLAFAGYALITFEWFFWGYSLTFSATGSKFMGNLHNFALMNIADGPSPASTRLPELVFVFYQGMFACITPVIAVAGMAERGRIGPCLVFMFCWATIVYNPIATWTWAAQGWGYTLGSLDFAGGGPVHMSSGTAALAYSLWVGKRRGYGTDRLAYKPHSVSHVVLGTVFLWFGWFGFNGGSALSSTLRAVNACIVTNLAAATAGLTWCVLDYRLERKFSAVGFCSGVLAGLVGITPAAGYVSAPCALAIGAIAGAACNFATKLKFLLRVDDAIDGFALHGIGGLVGSICTGWFAESAVIAYDGTELEGGWIDHHWKQMGYQLATSAATMGYSFVMTSILLVIIDKIPGLRLRMTDHGEVLGTDEDQLAEFAYDFTILNRDIDGHVDEEQAELGHLPHSGRPSPGSSVDEKKQPLPSHPPPQPESHGHGGHPRDPSNPLHAGSDS